MCSFLCSFLNNLKHIHTKKIDDIFFITFLSLYYHSIYHVCITKFFYNFSLSKEGTTIGFPKSSRYFSSISKLNSDLAEYPFAKV